MNHNLGEVSYDVRFARQKAKQDMAEIEGDWNSMVARMTAKGATLGVGGGGGGTSGSGGYAGATGGNGQPMQGVPARAASPMASALKGNSQHWAMRLAMNLPAGGATATLRDLAGNVIPLGGGNVSSNGQPVHSGPQTSQRMGNFQVQDIGGFRSNIKTGEITGHEIPATPHTQPTKLSPMAARALKAVGILSVAHTVTNFMGAVEQSLNESVAAASDPIKQRMASRNMARNIIGSVPFFGGGLQNLADFAGLGAANRADMVAMQSRGISEGQGLFRAGTQAGALGVAGITSRSPLLAAGFGAEAERGAAHAALNQELREKLRASPVEYHRMRTLFGSSSVEGDGPIKRGLYNDFAARGKVVDDTASGTMEMARLGTRMELFGQEAANKRLGLEAQLQPVAGAVGEIAENALNSYRINTSYNNSKMSYRKPGRRAQGVLIDPAVELTPEQEQRNKDVMTANELERANLRGAEGKLKLARTNVLQNMFGGRPAEINAMQSVEAMRDLSPETNESQLREISGLLKDIKDALAEKGAPH